MSKMVKILLKKILLRNIALISFAVVILITAILSSCITRYFDKVEYEKKIEFYRVLTKKKSNLQCNCNNNSSVDMEKQMPVTGIVPKDIVVSVEIVKSESKKNIDDKNQKSTKIASNNDCKECNSNNKNKRKTKQLACNKNITINTIKEKKYNRNDFRKQTAIHDTTNVINMVSNNLVFGDNEDNSNKKTVLKKEVIKGSVIAADKYDKLNNEGKDSDAVLSVDSQERTHVQDNGESKVKVDRLQNERKKDDIIGSVDVEVKTKTSNDIDDKIKPKKKNESDEIHNTIVLIKE